MILALRPGGGRARGVVSQDGGIPGYGWPVCAVKGERSKYVYRSRCRGSGLTGFSAMAIYLRARIVAMLVLCVQMESQLV